MQQNRSQRHKFISKKKATIRILAEDCCYPVFTVTMDGKNTYNETVDTRESVVLARDRIAVQSNNAQHPETSVSRVSRESESEFEKNLLSERSISEVKIPLIPTYGSPSQHVYPNPRQP